MHQERRRDVRYSLVRPVKLQCILTGRYYSGRTSDMSAGGAMVVVDNPSMFVPGQRMKLGVAWGHEALLSQEQLTEATVARCHGFGNQQILGLAFAERVALKATA